MLLLVLCSFGALSRMLCFSPQVGVLFHVLCPGRTLSEVDFSVCFATQVQKKGVFANRPGGKQFGSRGVLRAPQRNVESYFIYYNLVQAKRIQVSKRISFKKRRQVSDRGVKSRRESRSRSEVKFEDKSEVNRVAVADDVSPKSSAEGESSSRPGLHSGEVGVQSKIPRSRSRQGSRRASSRLAVSICQGPVY